jgi:hypothetical protein
MSDHEIIISSWARVTQLLDERSFNEADPLKKRGMRLASRSIRHSLAHAGQVRDADDALSQEVVRSAYNTMSEVLEELVADADAMARLIAARHPHHRRLNVCRVQLVRAFNTMARNIEKLRLGAEAKTDLGEAGASPLKSEKGSD